jgi:predicted MFS family arabinose efflux permease
VCELQKRSRPPYKTILTSLPVWAFLGVMTAHYFGTTILFAYIPLYLNDVFDFTVEEVGLVLLRFFLFPFVNVFSFYLILAIPASPWALL